MNFDCYRFFKFEVFLGKNEKLQKKYYPEISKQLI